MSERLGLYTPHITWQRYGNTPNLPNVAGTIAFALDSIKSPSYHCILGTENIYMRFIMHSQPIVLDLSGVRPDHCLEFSLAMQAVDVNPDIHM